MIVYNLYTIGHIYIYTIIQYYQGKFDSNTQCQKRFRKDNTYKIMLIFQYLNLSFYAVCSSDSLPTFSHFLYFPPSISPSILSISLQIQLLSLFYNTHSLNTTSIVTLATESMAGKDISIGFQVDEPEDVAQFKWSVLKIHQFKQSLHETSTAIVCSVGLQQSIRREIFYYLSWSQSSRYL